LADVKDAAQYVLELTGVIPAMKLQRLCYYAQAWSLVWDEEPLFENRIEAWMGGPACPDLYEMHLGEFKLGRLDGADSSRLSSGQKESIETVVDYYSRRNTRYLSELSKMEDPWRNAEGCKGLGKGPEIFCDRIAEYYGSL
jgi:uncharacterized phage-associated protein